MLVSLYIYYGSNFIISFGFYGFYGFYGLRGNTLWTGNCVYSDIGIGILYLFSVSLISVHAAYYYTTQPDGLHRLNTGADTDRRGYRVNRMFVCTLIYPIIS